MRRDLLDDGLADLLGLDRTDERRDGDRVVIRRRCTLHDPQSRRTVRGRTANVSCSGALLELDGRVLTALGHRVFVGIGDGARRRQDPELIAAEVARVIECNSDQTVLAVRTERTASTVGWIVRGAA